MMKPSEIIQASARKNGLNPSLGLSIVTKGLQNGLQLVQEDNSVLAFKILNQNEGIVAFFTLDSPLTYITSMNKFVHLLKKTAVKYFYIKMLDKSTEMALKKSHVSLIPSDNPSFQKIIVV